MLYKSQISGGFYVFPHLPSSLSLYQREHKHVPLQLFFLQHLIYILILLLPSRNLFFIPICISSLSSTRYVQLQTHAYTLRSIFTRMEIRSGSFSSLFKKTSTMKIARVTRTVENLNTTAKSRDPVKIYCYNFYCHLCLR